MNIGFLTPEYPHPKLDKSGGIGTSIFNLSNALSQLGHHVIIFAYGQNQDEYFVENRLHFYKIKNIKVKGLSLFLTQKKIERLINKLHKSHELDIVEAPDWTGFTAFVNTKCPLVIREHGSDTYFCHLDNRKVKFKNKYLEKRALKRADGVISVSTFTGQLTNTLFNINKKFTVIPNGIDLHRFEARKGQSLEQIIVYFGTIIRKKGVLELPHIFNCIYKKNPQVKLILVGKDSADNKTKKSSTLKLMLPQFTKQSVNNVNYLGEVSYSEIESIINKATVCVFPSFAEALPVSWLEAMAMEKPIVASNIGWAKEIIEDNKDGFLVHPNKHELYASRILELLRNPDLQETIGKAAREKIHSKFDSKFVAVKSLEFYKSILK